MVRVSYVGDRKFLAAIDRSGGDPTRSRHWSRSIDEERAPRQPSPCSRKPTRRDQRAVPRGARRCHPARRRREEAPRRHPCRGRGPDNPYDVASTMVDYLQSSANFKYDADVRDLACEGLSTVECFARYSKGYCQHYASTMAILLRERGIPTRLVPGSCPGDREGLVERVSVSAAHAWVEVYFPATAGWNSTRPAVAWPLRCHCRPANRLHRRASAVQKTAAIPSGGATPVAMRRRSFSWPCRGRPASAAAAGRAAARARQG